MPPFTFLCIPEFDYDGWGMRLHAGIARFGEQEVNSRYNYGERGLSMEVLRNCLGCQSNRVCELR